MIHLDAVGYCLVRQLAEIHDDYRATFYQTNGNRILSMFFLDDAKDEIDSRENARNRLANELVNHLRICPATGITFADWCWNEPLVIALEFLDAWWLGAIAPLEDDAP